MSSVMRPVGDKPPNVYWRRRVVAVVALLIVVLLLVWLIRVVAGAFGGDEPATTATSSPTTTTATASAAADPSVTATESATAAAACAEGSISVTATSEAKTVTAGEATKVGMVIENTGDAACTLDAGSANLELVISSGSERIWSSDDCQKEGESRPTTVDPGAKLASEVPWDVARSDESCSTGLSKLKAGTYQLTAQAGDWESAPLTLTVEA